TVMVNPGAFRGSRREFLIGEKANYSAAVVGGYASEALALIQRRYFKRFPIDLPHDEEPSAESLAVVDDEAPDPETTEPDSQRLTIEQFKAAMDLVEERRNLFAYRKAQIKRWLAYQHMKDNDLNPKESGAYNPYNAIMVKLTGKDVSRPRLKTAVNGKKERLATERDRIAREMFGRLSEEDQRHWKGVAMDEHNDTLKEYKKELELANSPSTAPADRQRCIQGLVRFAQPILDIICDVTGWKATLMVGGPEPAHDGRLNIISIHSGTTSGDVKMTFGTAERERYKKFVVPIFGSFLQKCYSNHHPTLRNSPASSPTPSPSPSLVPSPIPSPVVSPAQPPAPSPAQPPAPSPTQLPAPSPAQPPAPSPGQPPAPSPAQPPAPSPAQPTAPSPAVGRHSTRKTTHTAESTDDTTASLGPSTRKSIKRNLNVLNPSTSQPADDGHKPKRRKMNKTSLPVPSASTSATTSVPAAIRAPDNAPEWFENALSMVQSAALGPEWLELIQKWSTFEAKERYKEVAKLGNVNRPSSVGDWIKRGRSSTWRPEISNGNWDTLKRPGTNGLLSVICALFHWGTALQKNGKEVKQSQWITAVKDCINAYDGLLC
ncbi:hypothetical protein BDN70DRAFT_821516, partial [Pholiota conissans]